eukprot:Lankesteria_metandrocarpae@DN4850_c0_g1_i3.p1
MSGGATNDNTGSTAVTGGCNANPDCTEAAEIRNTDKVAGQATVPACVRLTQYSHGAGCGCKISPAVLNIILKTESSFTDPNLIVGNDTRDDAAVYRLPGTDTGIVSTTDFFMPIVDDPTDFGRIAATNAISDIYAMGAKPIMAIAILGWPIGKLDPCIAQQVVEGGRVACRLAGITLAGGHSIDAPEPIFGMAVTGVVHTDKVKKNSTGTSGCELFLTKPLGIGILTTAEKRGVLAVEDVGVATELMCAPNDIGVDYSDIEGIRAVTDVTGFGLGGHLIEMCEGSGLSAEIVFDKLPVLSNVQKYILEDKCVPGGTFRNYESYGSKLDHQITELQKAIICDPQTSGGLLIAVEAAAVDLVRQVTKDKLGLMFGNSFESIGKLVSKSVHSKELVKIK